MSSVPTHKSWSSYNDLLGKFDGRGMEIGDRPSALSALKRIGYYRLTGYSYPYREVDADGNVLDDFIAGTTMAEVISLYRFDEKLRSILLDGLQTIETAFGAHIAHSLGKANPVAHLDAAFLDTHACNRVQPGATRTAHELWTDRYEDLTPKPEHEEYVRHHEDEYEGEMPIWAAVQFLDFGALLRLYGLMRSDQRGDVSTQMGLKKRAPDVMKSWLLSMSTLRNHCAHGNRVWNRPVFRPLAKPATLFVGDSLHHLHDLSEQSMAKIYPQLAHIAYVIAVVSPASDWASSLKTHAKKLEKQTTFKLESTMGFPERWDELTLWGGSHVRIEIE